MRKGDRTDNASFLFTLEKVQMCKVGIAKAFGNYCRSVIIMRCKTLPQSDAFVDAMRDVVLPAGHFVHDPNAILSL